MACLYGDDFISVSSGDEFEVTDEAENTTKKRPTTAMGDGQKSFITPGAFMDYNMQHEELPCEARWAHTCRTSSGLGQLARARRAS